MQDAILIAKISIGSVKKKIVVVIFDAEVTRVCSATNVLLKYNCHLDLTEQL